MSNTQQSATTTVNGLIGKAQKLSKDLNGLINKSAVLLADSQHVKQRIIDSCGVQDNQLLKNLVKYCNDDERIHQLLENAELKQTLEEYKAGVDHIMGKYRQHCQENSQLEEHYQLRARYVAGLQEIVNNLEKRIEEMALLMMFTVTLEEHSSSENQRIIRQLSEENELLRRQLQISCHPVAKDVLQQAQPAQTECGTQVDAEQDFVSDSESDSDSSSSDSCHSFVTCFSYSIESPEKPQS
ncbi:FGFR1 oncogene partner 2 homolog [Drosophila albomicans]|uniref:FGFR1 oncogene partner 2 homolog n=1 Tax=Drosophila albomicans TaxID=7291 RepID=A0A9C6W7N6_DROAB|nr:FGFR1 oncogene partner 2 homolog [Drosophila albomicans]